MKKWLIRITLGIIVLVVVGLVVAFYSLGNIVKNRVETIGPQVTKVDVKLDSANVWLVPGRVQLKGLSVGNPPGCKTEIAIKMGEISVRMNPMTALSDRIIVDSIMVKSPEITLEGGLKKNNLTKIQKNVSDYAGSEPGSSPADGKSATDSKPGKKYQINEIVITGARLHIISLFATGANVSLSLPEIRLANLGTGQEGITSPEVMQKALTALLNSIAENAADAIENLGKNAASTVKKFDFKKAGEKIKGIFGQ